MGLGSVKHLPGLNLMRVQDWDIPVQQNLEPDESDHNKLTFLSSELWACALRQRSLQNNLDSSGDSCPTWFCSLSPSSSSRGFGSASGSRFGRSSTRIRLVMETSVSLFLQCQQFWGRKSRFLYLFGSAQNRTSQTSWTPPLRCRNPSHTRTTTWLHKSKDLCKRSCLTLHVDMRNRNVSVQLFVRVRI